MKLLTTFRTLLFLLLILIGTFLSLGASPAEAQTNPWSLSPNGIYHMGNVGVGYQYPNARLTVKGPFINDWTGQLLVQGTDSHGVITVKPASSYSVSQMNFANGEDNKMWSWSARNLVDGYKFELWHNTLGSWYRLMSISPESVIEMGVDHGGKINLNGRVRATCNAGEIVTGHITAIGWYTSSFSDPLCNWDNASKARIVLTQNNSGTGDISIISFRIKKNSVTTNSFQIEYYVNAIPTPGTTKFNWVAVED